MKQSMNDWFTVMQIKANCSWLLFFPPWTGFPDCQLASSHQEDEAQVKAEAKGESWKVGTNLGRERGRGREQEEWPGHQQTALSRSGHAQRSPHQGMSMSHCLSWQYLGMYRLSLGMCRGWGGGTGIHYCPVSGTDCVILTVCWESSERTSKLVFYAQSTGTVISGQ